MGRTLEEWLRWLEEEETPPEVLAARRRAAERRRAARMDRHAPPQALNPHGLVTAARPLVQR